MHRKKCTEFLSAKKKNNNNNAKYKGKVPK